MALPVTVAVFVTVEPVVRGADSLIFAWYTSTVFPFAGIEMSVKVSSGKTVAAGAAWSTPFV